MTPSSCRGCEGVSGEGRGGCDGVNGGERGGRKL